VALLAVVACLSGCSGPAPLDGSSPAFAGLDPRVVTEVLENPTAARKISEEPESTRDSMAQGIVRNFIVCREFLSAYETWLRSGVAPSSPPLPTPSNPLDPSASGWAQEYQNYAGPLNSGDISELKAALTNESGCGVWVPAKPGDVSGPTIADVVTGES
jgi:hypothetical protein